MRVSLTITAVSIFLGVLGVVQVFAAAPKYPVPSLGNCRDKQECFYYCEIPSHQEVCQTYAASLGGTQVLGDTTYSFPIASLGNCNNRDECRTFCSNPNNRSACVAFSQSQGGESWATTTTGGSATTGIVQNLQTFIAQAKQVLGCDYATTCRDFCNQAANKQKCSDFVRLFTGGKSVPVPSGTPPMMPGITAVTQELMSVDCNQPTNASKCGYVGTMCGNFCQKNPSLCKPGTVPTPPRPSVLPRPPQTNAILEKVKQVSGCTTSQECEAYCRAHADICKSFYPTPMVKPSLSPHQPTM